MNYSIQKDPNIHAIMVEASGIINTQVAEDMVMEAGVALNDSDFNRCFFDLSKTEVDPEQTLTEMISFSATFQRAGIRPSVKMAALYTSGEDPRLYLEHGATFIGLTLKHFKDKQEALSWLCA